MPHSIRLIALLICLTCAAFGQTAGDNGNLSRQLQSAASGGGTMTDGSTLYWSLGEMSTVTLENGGSTLAQGFWQISVLPAGPKTESQQESPLFQITCFPNPLSSELTVNWTDETKTLRANLYDLAGQLLETTLVRGGSHRFDFAARPAGTYLLRLDNESGAQVQTFKLQKQQ